MPQRPGIHSSPLLRLLAQWRLFLWNTHPARLLFVGYFAWLLLGWGLLALPWSQDAQVAPLDTLFIAIAALSGGGLSPVDVAQGLSPLGEGVLLVLMQIGGLGYMTLGSFAYLAISDRLHGLRDRTIRAAFGLSAAMDVRLFLRSVVIFTLVAEALGTLVLWALFARAGVENPLWQGLFHAVSAFCTTGFSLLPGGFEPFRADTAINAAVMILALLGAVGFLVVVDLWRLARGDAEGLGFSSTVILRIFPVLVLGGALLLALAEPSIASLPPGERVLASLFQSVNAATTAGFNSVPVASVAPAGAIVLIVLMVIGGAPASTSGGLKVTTFAALWGLVGDVVAGRRAVAIFGRRIGEDRLRLATASLCYYLALTTLATFALAITEAGTPLGTVAFEVISCLSTVGLSQGLTAEVSTAGHVILILLMFAGRVGLITFAIAIALPPGHELYEEGHDLVL
jgi:trk system potassium uptake protein TrkH